MALSPQQKGRGLFAHVFVALLASCFMSAASAADGGVDRHGFSAGVTLGWSEFRDDSIDGYSYGVVGRYTYETDDSTFLRVQAEWVQDTHKDGISFTQTGYYAGNRIDVAVSELERDWTGDLLFLLGASADVWSPYFGIGPSWTAATNPIRGTVTNQSGSVTVELDEDATHMGWKAVVGADFDLGGMELTMQASYTDYEEEDYGILGKLDPGEELGLRIGLLFRF